MLWRRTRSAEVLPWYRNPNYRGPLTESEKRKLDAFRSEPRHPSTRYEDLAEEVQRYIVALEGEVYDLKQEKAAAKAILCTLVGVALLYQHYRPLSIPTLLVWAVGLSLVLVPWLVYKQEWAKNASEYLPDDPASAIDEAIRREWEIGYLARSGKRNDNEA